MVWFKRDLRLEDHAPLVHALKAGPCILLFILEPLLWQQPDMSARHFQFLTESIVSLQQRLLDQDLYLIIRVGDAASIIKHFIDTMHVTKVWSHQETWNDWTYQRDIAVKSMLESEAVPWQEYPNNGVIRRLKNRDGWAKKWYSTMNEPILGRPVAGRSIQLESDIWPDHTQLNLKNDYCRKPQKAGRLTAERLLESFLHERGRYYSKEMSSPITAYQACSRLSPYIAFGIISIREVYQRCKQRQMMLKIEDLPGKTAWLRSIRSLMSRLRWHCHFIQKLEDEPSIEFKALHQGYADLRPAISDQTKMLAWQQGQTGFPFVDACMRALISTGWINFRMRAMLVSFATYHLWLRWQDCAVYLATLFTDYEPGIHYSQIQMQSGVTGMNAIRIYNPIKQSVDQDPNGVFIKRWVPELTSLSADVIHEPWTHNTSMLNYPQPVIDEVSARKFAASQIFARRKLLRHDVETQRIVKKHASRKINRQTNKRVKKHKPSSQSNAPNQPFQQELPL